MAGLLIAAGALAGIAAVIAAPAVALSLAALPALLVSDDVRCWWRDRKGYFDRRPAVPKRLADAVRAADRGRCAFCGQPPRRGRGQLDHIKPYSVGGLHSFWNLMLLCNGCNRAKSNYWIRRDGTVYDPFGDPILAQRAEEILLFELAHRWNPARWVRAGWSLAA